MAKDGSNYEYQSLCVEEPPATDTGMRRSFSSTAQQLFLKFLSLGPVPKHMVFLMSGEGQPRHRTSQSLDEVQGILQWAKAIGCRTFTFHVLNGARLEGDSGEAQDVLEWLQHEMDRYLNEEDERLRGCTIRFYGRKEKLPRLTQIAMKRVEAVSQRGRTIPACHVNVSIACSSSEEIARAVQKVQDQIFDNSLTLLADVTREAIMENTYFTFYPAPDLVVCVRMRHFDDFLLFQTEKAMVISINDPLDKFISFLRVIFAFQLSVDATNNYDYNVEVMKRKAKGKKKKRKLVKYAALRGFGFMLLLTAAYLVYLRFAETNYRV